MSYCPQILQSDWLKLTSGIINTHILKMFLSGNIKGPSMVIPGPYSLTWIKVSEKSAQDQIRIKENGSADLWLKSVFTKEGSAEPKICKNFS